MLLHDTKEKNNYDVHKVLSAVGVKDTLCSFGVGHSQQSQRYCYYIPRRPGVMFKYFYLDQLITYLCNSNHGTSDSHCSYFPAGEHAFCFAVPYLWNALQ